MRFRTLTPVFALLLGTAGAASAQESSERGWIAGAGVIATETIYAGEGMRTLPFPMVGFEGERFYLRGLTGGMKLVKREGLSVDALIAFRGDMVDPEDLNWQALRDNGVDPRRLVERDRSLDAGVSAKLDGGWGEVRAAARRDVLDKSDGYELTLDYGYPIRAGRSLWTPRVGMSRYSDDLANYYFGVSSDEMLPGQPGYSPGSATFRYFGIDHLAPIGERWVWVSNVAYTRVPSTLSRSPLADRDADSTFSVMTSLFYRF